MKEQVFDKLGWADGFHYLSRNLSKYILVISFGYVIGLITKDLSKNIINDNVNSNFTMIFTLLGFILTAVAIRSMMLNKPKLDFKQASHNEGLAPYFREFLRGELKKWCQKNTKSNGEKYNLYTDGLKVYTTINSTIQEYAEQAVTTHMSYLQKQF